MEQEQKKSLAAKREEKVLEFWRENKVFEQSLEKKSPKGEFVFYEGPPTANGKPGIHHLEARAFKDAIPRYKTMQGFHVRRKGGWDTHGLPVELQVEKALGLKSKKEIEGFGVAEFNKKCKESVWEYRDIWEKFTDRIGFWVDQKNPYVTYHNSYIESVWNVLSKVNDKGLLYKDYKVVPWCPRCGTALSSHELAQGYEDVKDLSVYVKFKVKGEENTYVLAWTTTPWTLPGNVGLAVGEDIEYVKVKKENEVLILAQARTEILGEGCEVIEKITGKNLTDLEYEPLYPFLKDNISEDQKANLANAFKVYAADFVTTTDGTGIVHTAVMYGQEDFDLGTKVGLPKFHLVNDDGTFKDIAGFLAGKKVGDEETAVEIIKDLAHRGLLFKKEKYEHSYPFCWRCKTRLIYFARDSWYIRMSSLRSELMKENESINWEPAHTREGRFGQWLEEVKDWAISRERYWGTPLPIWTTATGKMKVVSSVEDLKKHAKKSGNSYFVMRHGGTEGNQKGIVSFKEQESDHLTEKGKQQVRSEVGHYKGKIDLIIASPFTRTRETAEIVREELGLDADALIIDERLHEVNAGDFDGKSWDDYHNFVYNMGQGWYERKIPNGESLQDVGKRVGEALYDLEEKYKGKNILIVTHGGPAWLCYVVSGEYVPENQEYQVANSHAFVKEFKRFQNGEIRKLDFVPLPHNEHFELDLHKPYIDDIKLVDEDGEEMTRVKEVMDVWFDSGAMPYAQDHYPFENKEWVDGPGYPADFISEAIDQTRGWFYTLHAVGVLLGRGKAYKNVICLGHILDANGKKMSKSQGNIVDPWTMIEKYGVDTLRMWMYSVNQPGDSKNFDEKTVAELQAKVFTLLYNVLSFYELYRDPSLEVDDWQSSEKTHVIDRWIWARSNELQAYITEELDNYRLFGPVRALKDFIDDLSTWYLRRSRERIKQGDTEAKKMLYFMLKRTALMLAPFAPFTAEDIYRKLKQANNPESVHLADWPHFVSPDADAQDRIQNMQLVRDICTAGNAERKKLNIPVRQPLLKITTKQKVEETYAQLIQDELNVKEVVTNSELSTEVELDTNITPELKKEGDYRELVRAVQDLRKKMELTPSDRVSLAISKEGEELLKDFMQDFQKTVQADSVSFDATDGDLPAMPEQAWQAGEVKVGEQNFIVKISKN